MTTSSPTTFELISRHPTLGRLRFRHFLAQCNHGSQDLLLEQLRQDGIGDRHRWPSVRGLEALVHGANIMGSFAGAVSFLLEVTKVINRFDSRETKGDQQLFDRRPLADITLLTNNAMMEDLGRLADDQLRDLVDTTTGLGVNTVFLE